MTPSTRQGTGSAVACPVPPWSLPSTLLSPPRSRSAPWRRSGRGSLSAGPASWSTMPGQAGAAAVCFSVLLLLCNPGGGGCGWAGAVMTRHTAGLPSVLFKHCYQEGGRRCSHRPSLMSISPTMSRNTFTQHVWQAGAGLAVSWMSSQVTVIVAAPLVVIFLISALSPPVLSGEINTAWRRLLTGNYS